MTAASIPLCQRLGSFAAAPGEIPGVVSDIALWQLQQYAVASMAQSRAAQTALLDRAWARDRGPWSVFRDAAGVFSADAVWTEPVFCTIQTVIVPALHACGRENLTAALAVAAEVTCRLHVALQPRLAVRHTPSYTVLGPLGAAVAVAKAGGGTASQIANAIAVAGSLACGASEIADSDAGAYLAGWAAQNGLLAGQLGIAGFTGPALALEGERGLFKAFAGGWDSTAAPVVDGLGTDWLLADLVRPGA